MTHYPRKKAVTREEDRLRRQMRVAGFRLTRIWAPDTKLPDFIEECRRQSRAVAASDPGGDEIMEFVAALHDWPKDE